MRPIHSKHEHNKDVPGPIMPYPRPIDEVEIKELDEALTPGLLKKLPVDSSSIQSSPLQFRRRLFHSKAKNLRIRKKGSNGGVGREVLTQVN